MPDAPAPPGGPDRAAPVAVVDRLLADGLLRRDGPRLRTTRRWQGALARSALGLLRAGAPSEDLRLPIVAAVLALYPELTDDAALEYVRVLLPIEAAELGPGLAGGAGPPSP